MCHPREASCFTCCSHYAAILISVHLYWTHRIQSMTGPQRKGLCMGGIREFSLYAGPERDLERGTSDTQMFGAQGQRAVNTNGGWCFRALGLQGRFQGRLLSLGLVLLADFSPVPFLFSSSNVLHSFFRNQHPRLPWHPQRSLMLINAPLALDTTVSSVFNNDGHLLCLSWSRLCAEHLRMSSHPILSTTHIC